MSSSADSYQKNYQRLKAIAEIMRNEEELDVDLLIPLVSEATEAYKKCMARIEAVESALKSVEVDEMED